MRLVCVLLAWAAALVSAQEYPFTATSACYGDGDRVMFCMSSERVCHRVSYCWDEPRCDAKGCTICNNKVPMMNSRSEAMNSCTDRMKTYSKSSCVVDKSAVDRFSEEAKTRGIQWKEQNAPEKEL